ncbi:MAG: type II secretion system protein [Rickettsiales bacterium]
MFFPQRSATQAFSLVELSIVLVILGLLTGGILAGQSLIRAAELRAVTTEYARYVTAVQSFRDKYFAIPGDMPNASQFWTSIPGTVGCTTSTTCGNGDGGGTITPPAFVASSYSENLQVWNELALSGLIEGSYPGTTGPTNGGNGAMDTIPGTNSPKSKLSNAGWGVWWGPPGYPGQPNIYAGNFGNSLVFGGVYGGFAPIGSRLKPEEAWNIDTKLDDGVPNKGKVYAGNPGTCTLVSPGGAASAGTSTTPEVYSLQSSTVGCALFFPGAF